MLIPDTRVVIWLRSFQTFFSKTAAQCYFFDKSKLGLIILSSTNSSFAAWLFFKRFGKKKKNCTQNLKQFVHLIFFKFSPPTPTKYMLRIPSKNVRDQKWLQTHLNVKPLLRCGWAMLRIWIKVLINLATIWCTPRRAIRRLKKCAFILLCQRLRLAGTNSIIDPNLMCTGLLACQMWGASLRPSQSKPTSEVALRMSWKERVYYVMMKLNMTLALLKIQALYLAIMNLNKYLPWYEV